MKWNKKYKILTVLMMALSSVSAWSVQPVVMDTAEVPHIIYHTADSTIIYRDAFTEGYSFNADYPSFYTGIGYMNMGWNTQADGTGITYRTGDKLESLTKDLDVYPMLQSGHYVRFDSQKGTPIRYQFVNHSGTATKPTDPTREGYSFAGWTLNGSNYNFDTAVTEDIILVAKWDPAQTQYMIRIWLENSNRDKRTSFEDAQSHVTEDFTYGGSLTKKCLSGSTVEFTSADQNKNEYKKIVYYSYDNGTTLISPLYFLDNENGSYAKDLTDASIKSVNDNEKVRGDGSTVVNVYLRKLYYNLKLYDSTGDILSKSISYSLTHRVDEKVGHAVIRNGITLDSNFEAFLKRDFTELGEYYYIKNYSRVGKEYVTNVLMWDENADDPVLFNVYSNNNLNDKENASYYIKNGETGNVIYKRYWYVQTLESAINNDFPSIDVIDDTKFDKFAFYTYYEKNTSTNNDYKDGYLLEDKTGFTFYYRDIADRHGSSVVYLQKTTKINGISGEKVLGIDGNPQRLYEGEYTPYKNSKGTLYWQLDNFYLRNAYEVAFETFTEQIKVKSSAKFNKVFYEEPLKNIAPYIVSESGNSFVKGETYYLDDQLVRWVFQGWYDNVSLAGTPIDFSNTDLTMPAHNIVIYAKWEAQPIHATFMGNGGTIDGQPTKVEEFYAGNVPLKPRDPVPPTGMKFLCWTLDGVYYDFSEPLYEDVEIVAQYYSNEKLKVTYNAGEGSGKVPVDANTYTYNANPKVMSPTNGLIAPEGKYFSHWVFDNKDYLPNEVVYVTKNVSMIAAYKEYLTLTIKKKGMKEGESASFTVTKTGDAKTSFNVLLTGNGEESAEVTIMVPDSGEYTVTETSWSWAYNETQLAPITKTLTSGNITFEFTNVEKDKTPLHSEAIKNNSVIGYEKGSIIVDVEAWKNGGKKKIKF